ncbi:MAG: response regulator transcription factor [Crocinitomicaceae bacterium]|nr:response regulator transcription factor [Crocinitomicaceae bacterium]
MKKILLVEDEESLINVLSLNFEIENYHVTIARNGEEALDFFSDEFDIVILDIMIPLINGFDVCAAIRAKSSVPILIISAKGNSTDRINGLKLGADDYLVKPFDLEELLLRVNILISRNSQDSGNQLNEYQFGKNKINFLDYTASNGIEEFQLSAREIALLKLLVERKNTVVSRDEILDVVWGEENFPTSRTIDNYIVSLRKYFEINPKEPFHFVNLRGVGYKFQE